MYSRTSLVLGDESIDILKNKKVSVFGIGGVGSFVVEALARIGIGTLVLVDKDNIDISNINRQIHANTKTIGKSKVEVMRDRIRDINKDINVLTYKTFYINGDEDCFHKDSDYIVDAIDNITAKLLLISNCKNNNIPIISSMGTANKIDPTRFMVDDIYNTKVCPLAKVMRKECKKRDIKDLKVIYSDEKPVEIKKFENGKPVQGSVSFVPSVAGLIIAGELVKDILKKEGVL